MDDIDHFLKIRKGYGAIIWTNDKNVGPIQAAVQLKEQDSERPKTIVEDPAEPS